VSGIKAAEDARDEPTLANILRSLVDAKLPSTFYQLLQFGIPFGLQLWTWGWYRSAGWMAVLSLFGIWALCEQRLEQQRTWQLEGRDQRAQSWVAVARRLSGFGASILTAGLLFEGFLHLLGAVFKCPGCAG
jgi:hypothetical protein